MAQDKAKPSAAPQTPFQEQKLHPPVLPMVWLLAPLFAGLIYGLLTR